MIRHCTVMQQRKLQDCAVHIYRSHLCHVQSNLSKMASQDLGERQSSCTGGSLRQVHVSSAISHWVIMQFQHFQSFFFKDFFSFFIFSLAFYVQPNGAHTTQTHTCTCTHNHTQVHKNSKYVYVCFHALLCGCECVYGV